MWIAEIWRYPVKSIRRIAQEFGGRMALDCGVVSGGRIALGDLVELEGGEEA
jgi:hypothetical protein